MAYCMRLLLVVSTLLWAMPLWAAPLFETIAQVKPSVVAIANFNALRQPQMQAMGTGFAVADGQHVITNFHVIESLYKQETDDRLVVMVGVGSAAEMRIAEIVQIDPTHDLALLKFEGARIAPLNLRENEEAVSEGLDIAITGYPIGPVLGLYAATHKGIVAAVTPNAIPQGRASQIDANFIRRARFDIYQLDVVAYPGNSGSPLYLADTGEVIGVINSTFIKDTKELALSDPSGISYAIPIKFARQLLRREKLLK